MVLETINKEELKNFVEENEIGERFNYDAEFMYRLNEKDKLVGVIAYMLQKDRLGNEYPRFIHVILDKSVRRSKVAFKFLQNTFDDLKSKGYSTVVAIIPSWKKHMMLLAIKAGFVRYTSDKEYGYFRRGIN